MSDLVTRKPIFFGDGKYTFELTPPMILELEAKTGVGIGTLMKRAASRNNLDFRFTEICEVIRLGLIGGGLAPARALQLIETYVHGLPMINSQIITMQVLEALFFGHDPKEDDLAAKAEALSPANNQMQEANGQA